VWSAQRVLESATLGGARALGLDARLGSLVPGKCADMVAVDLTATAMLPCYDLRSHLVHVAGRESVTDVWIDGERVVENRRVRNVDEAQIAARARAWQEKLR
jgi:5-methylthioadenosine/S-adenosylhomocysteine deaminase